MVAVQCDVTNEEQVGKACDLVRNACNGDHKGGLRLHTLVNNAGIQMGSLVDLTSMPMYHSVSSRQTAERVFTFLLLLIGIIASWR